MSLGRCSEHNFRLQTLDKVIKAGRIPTATFYLKKNCRDITVSNSFGCCTGQCSNILIQALYISINSAEIFGQRNVGHVFQILSKCYVSFEIMFHSVYPMISYGEQVPCKQCYQLKFQNSKITKIIFFPIMKLLCAFLKLSDFYALVTHTL